MSSKTGVRPRRIRPAPRKKGEGKQTPTAYERQVSVATNYIMRNRHYPTILAMFRLGTSNPDIADFFIERGEFAINRKTAISYLSKFRNAHPHLCKPVDPDTDGGVISYDHLFDGNMAVMSTDIEMAKLISLQKTRIAIDFEKERTIGKLFNTTHKEVAILGELIDRYAKLRGGAGNRGSVSADVPLSEEVRDGIQNIQHDESNRAALTNAIYDLVNGGKK